MAQRLSFPVFRWLLEKEAETRVPVVDWLDALSMALVTHDWSRHPDRCQMLADQTGSFMPWQPTHLDRIMALPSTTLETPPPRLEPQATFDQIFEPLQM